MKSRKSPQFTGTVRGIATPHLIIDALQITALEIRKFFSPICKVSRNPRRFLEAFILPSWEINGKITVNFLQISDRFF